MTLPNLIFIRCQNNLLKLDTCVQDAEMDITVSVQLIWMLHVSQFVGTNLTCSVGTVQLTCMHVWIVQIVRFVQIVQIVQVVQIVHIVHVCPEMWRWMRYLEWFRSVMACYSSTLIIIISQNLESWILLSEHINYHNKPEDQRPTNYAISTLVHNFGCCCCNNLPLQCHSVLYQQDAHIWAYHHLGHISCWSVWLCTVASIWYAKFRPDS